MKNLFAGAAVLMLCISVANAEEAKDDASAATIELAKQYLKAYSTFDATKFGPYLAEDTVFTDPTSTDQNADGGPFVFEGKETVIKELSDYAGQYQRFSLNYDFERIYESNGVVVFVANLGYELETKDGRSAEGAAPIVTAITVRDGKIAGHTDYYDYQGNAVDHK